MQNKQLLHPFISGIKATLSYLHPTCLFVLIFTLPLHYTYQRLALWFFFCTYILDYLLNQRWKNLKWTMDKWEYVAMTVFFLLIPLYHLFESSNTDFYFRTLERRLPFLAFGLIGLLGISPKIKLRYIGYAFILASVGTAAYLILFKIGLVNFFSNPQPSLTFAQARIESINSHMTYNLFLNVSLIFSFYILRHKEINKYIKAVVGLCVFFIYYILSISEGRVGFATSNILLCIFILSYAWKRSYKLFVPLTCICCLGAGIIIMNHDRIKDDAIENDPRKYIWMIGLQTFEEHPWIGHGTGDGRVAFVENGLNNELFRTHYYFPLIQDNKNFHGEIYDMHPHNVFLNTGIEFGVIGIVLLCFIFFYILAMSPHRHKLYMAMFFCVYLAQAMFESFGPHLMPFMWGLNVVLWNLGQDDGFNFATDQIHLYGKPSSLDT